MLTLCDMFQQEVPSRGPPGWRVGTVWAWLSQRHMELVGGPGQEWSCGRKGQCCKQQAQA